jgi:hypothetical protein
VERQPTGGGAATAAGIGFQARVAAWVAVQILAEREAPTPWDLGRHITLTAVSSETANPVDDLLVATSEGGFAFIQVKTGLRVSDDPRGGLARSFQQFAQQFVSSRDGRSPAPGRPLDPQRDRLVLVSGASSSEDTQRCSTAWVNPPTSSRTSSRFSDTFSPTGLSSRPIRPRIAYAAVASS